MASAMRNWTKRHCRFPTPEGCAWFPISKANARRTCLTPPLECVRELGVPIEKVLVVGGGARSRAVQSLAAEFLGVPVEFPEAAEYVALGAARQAGMLHSPTM